LRQFQHFIIQLDRFINLRQVAVNCRGNHFNHSTQGRRTWPHLKTARSVY
jgi:hypothetical protein